MPKASPNQPNFSGGEFAAKVKGRVEADQYKTGLDTCLNYLPLVEGPVTRRPGMKYSGADAKDPSKPPALLEFKFSQSQNYVLEFGDQYIRFFTNDGQITTTSTHFKVMGNTGTINLTYASSNLYAMRTSPLPNPGEIFVTSSVIQASSVLEIGSPYVYPDVHNLKVAQKEDTLFIVHSSYPVYKLQRMGTAEWDLKPILLQDGPYLPFNSYSTTGDSLRYSLALKRAPLIIYNDGSFYYQLEPTRFVNCSSIVNNGAGLIRVKCAQNHNISTGEKVSIRGVVGTTEANNGTSTIASLFWKAIVVTSDTIDLEGSTFVNAYVGSGAIYPAFFQPNGSPTNFIDVGRLVALERIDGGRSWVRINRVLDMSRAEVQFEQSLSPSPIATSMVSDSFGFYNFNVWQMASLGYPTAFPTAVAFHQDRLFLAGMPKFPQRIEASVTSEYENFQSSGSSFIVSDNNALSFSLLSNDLNKIVWMRSDTQGLLAGTFSSEWNITPSNQAAALTPTNFNAAQTSYFGSGDADAAQAASATLYIQRGQQRLRELNYFFQINTYRSTDLAERAVHLTSPGITKMSVQKEPVGVVWCLRNDGQLISMSYSRDDQSLKAGWARHQLGGQSDSGGTAPVVKSIATIPSPDGTYDQVWMAVQRFINSTSVVNIEYMTHVFDDSIKQEDAFQVDCGATYDSPKTITAVTNIGSTLVTAAAHGFSNADFVKINDVVGLNTSILDVNMVLTNSNLLNGNVFIVASAATNSFFLTDMDGNYVNPSGYSPYVSGGTVRKLVSSISGFTWLKNETVSVLADGGIHPPTTINSAGVLALQFPAAKVQVGYSYNSDLKTLRPDVGSADGSAIGKIRRVSRAALMLNNVGEMSIGPSFTNLTPLEFSTADVQQADEAQQLFSGIMREGIESQYDFEGQVCARQSGPLPGMIQSITTVVETNDV